MVQRPPQRTHQAQINTGSSMPLSVPLLSCTQVDLTNEGKWLHQFLGMLRSDAGTSASRRLRRSAGCRGAPAFAFWNPEAVHSSSVLSGLPAEPAAKEILSVCKGSWAAAAHVMYEAKMSRAEGFIGQHDFYRSCVNFKHLPFSARVLLLCIKLPLSMIYLLGRRHGLHLQ